MPIFGDGASPAKWRHHVAAAVAIDCQVRRPPLYVPGVARVAGVTLARNNEEHLRTSFRCRAL